MNTRAKTSVSKAEIELQMQAASRIRDILEKDFEKTKTRKSAFIETYGCAQNLNDSEKILGMLCDMGFCKADDRKDADVIIFNTCAVRENAELKVFGNIGALKHLKQQRQSEGRNLIIGVCGCMMQQREVAEQVKKKYKHVDMIFGTHSLHRLPQLLLEAMDIEKTHAAFDVEDSNGVIIENIPMVRKEGVLSLVSIMYGCNNFCSYCIVPYVRGRERSRSKNEILAEVRSLAQKGFKEIMLLGQNVNSYGNDLDDGFDFADLLSEVCKINGIERIRFMTSHPKDISDKLIDVMAKEDKICNQLHLPIQAGSNSVLKAMNRRYTKEQYLEKIDKIRAKIPEITLTSDIIVGFPGETQEDFEETIKILKRVRFDSVYSFVYSKRPGTPAATMPDVMTQDEKKKNLARLMDVQGKISKEINQSYEGTIQKVLIEGESKTDKEFLTGRTEGGKIVNFKADKALIGEMVNVKITCAHSWSLFGEI